MKKISQKQTYKGQSRRDFLKINALAGAGLMFPWISRADHESIIKNIPKLDVTQVVQFQRELFVPPVMPKTEYADHDYYEIGVRQFTQQILPPPYPKTLVAGYGPAGAPISTNAGFSTPAPTIAATAGRRVRVKWANQQVDANNNFLPHVLAEEMFPDHVMWANPAGPIDSHGRRFVHNPYRGPVPVVTHLHGGHNREEADGFPTAWFLPSANNLTGFAPEGSKYVTFEDVFAGNNGSTRWDPGTATFDYTNNEIATLLWYHDHTLGITEHNVYAGAAGGYVVAGGRYDIASQYLPQAPFAIPLVIQDRSFSPDGSRLVFGHGDGDAIMVNGGTWPKLTVEKRRYRFRILNGCNNRTLKLQFANGFPFWVIGSDIGFLPRAVQLTSLPLANAERADVIVDFTNVNTGTEFFLLNQGGDVRPNTTGRVMKLVVGGAASTPDTSLPPSQLGALPVKTLPTGNFPVRKLAILDERQGIIDAAGNVISLEFEDQVTEDPVAGSTEIWEFYGFDSHPMHLHAMDFQVLSRQRFGSTSVQQPKAWERGLKDTVDIHESGVTRVKVQFANTPGLFVWHCHILSHEDLGMMRPLVLRQPPV